jgi:hypothetical protein
MWGALKNRHSSARLHGVTSHKTAVFELVHIQSDLDVEVAGVSETASSVCAMKFVSFGNVTRQVNKVKVKVNFILEQATKAQKGSRGIALLFL